MNSDTILIGLDHNLVVDLADEAIRLYQDEDPRSAVHRELLELLHRGVHVDQHWACPTTEFTATETGTRPEFLARNQGLSEELSGGLAIREFGESLRFQIVARIDELLGGGASEHEPEAIRRRLFIDSGGYHPRPDPELRNLCFRVDWSERNRAPRADPDALARKARMARVAADEARLLQARGQRAQGVIRAHLEDGSEFFLAYRAWAEGRHDGSDFFIVDEELHRRKLATHRALFPGRPFIALSGLTGPIPWDHPHPRDVDGDFVRLIESGELALIDSAQIYGALMLELSRERRTGRVVSANDAYDVLRASTMIPVVDLYATDGLVKGMLDRSGVAAEYGVEVFGGSRRELDRFREELLDRDERTPADPRG